MSPVHLHVWWGLSCWGGLCLSFWVESQEQREAVCHLSSLPTLPGFFLSLSSLFLFWLLLMSVWDLCSLSQGSYPYPAVEGEVLTCWDHQDMPPGFLSDPLYNIRSSASCFPQIFSLFPLCFISSCALDLLVYRSYFFRDIPYNFSPPSSLYAS